MPAILNAIFRSIFWRNSLQFLGNCAGLEARWEGEGFYQELITRQGPHMSSMDQCPARITSLPYFTRAVQPSTHPPTSLPPSHPPTTPTHPFPLPPHPQPFSVTYFSRPLSVCASPLPLPTLSQPSPTIGFDRKGTLKTNGKMGKKCAKFSFYPLFFFSLVIHEDFGAPLLGLSLVLHFQGLQEEISTNIVQMLIVVHIVV